jgi:mediator of RNA polymerase II transcription subunit 4
MNGIQERSMSADLIEPVQQLGALAQTLFASLGPAQTRPPLPPPTSAFLAVDDALRAAVARAREHQARQRQIVRLEDELLELDARWRAACAELEAGRRELAALVDEGDARLSAIREAKACEHFSYFPRFSLPIRHVL